MTNKDATRILTQMETLGQILRTWRLMVGITETEAAVRCQMSGAQWSRLENDKRTDLRSETFLKLAEGTSIAPERLHLAAGISRMRKFQERQSALTASPA